MQPIMRQVSTVPIAIMCFLVGCGTPKYKVISFPSAVESYARRISRYDEAGRLQMPGTQRCPQHNNNCAHLWVVDVTLYNYELDQLAGNVESQALGINDVFPNKVVGWARIGSDQKPFLWERNKTTQLPTIGPQAQAYDVNDQGQIVGWCETANLAHHACRWSPGGTPEDLGTLGGNSSEAAAINNAGQIAGWAEAADGARHAFIWTPGGIDGVASNPQMRDIYIPFRAIARAERVIFSGSTAVDLNEAGHVVGVVEGEGVLEGFFWSASGGGTTLGEGEWTSALGINNSDIIVGYSQSSSGGARTAVIWSATRERSDLNDELDANSGWYLESAGGINDHGDIAASGYNVTSTPTRHVALILRQK